MLPDCMLRVIRAIWPQSLEVLKNVWETPETLANTVQKFMHASIYWTEDLLHHVQIAGPPGRYILYFQSTSQLLLCIAQESITSTPHPFLNELIEEYALSFEEYKLDPYGICLVAPLNESLKARLDLPTVLLASLFHSEMYPTARLTLGIAYLASYLRQQHLATVHLMDCQLGVSVPDIVEQVRQLRPHILGLSVNFGQFDLMEQALNLLFDPEQVEKPPLIVLGNILPAMCFREILKVYPQVVICRKEGELALAMLLKQGLDRSRWHQVPGIYFCTDQERIVSTPPRYLSLEDLPPPALDTLPALFAQDGVVTAEFSRGCQYNQCSFCPRSHKGSIWRTVPVSSMLQQWSIFTQAFQHFQRTPHVFLADEDFVGKEDGDATIRRLTDFLDGVQSLPLSVTFDASCRADQIYREDRDSQWHLERGKLFQRCLDGGLSRLFLGVESGAAAQLLRYNKGSSIEEMISAIRYLSLLGVRLRFGFIFFDPLMTLQDVLENIDFLGRTDVILPPEKKTSVEEVYAFVSSHHRQPLRSIRGPAVYEDVSYMVSPLEVLAKSSYHFQLQQQAPTMVSSQLDVSFARYSTSYVLPEIGIICKACQYWVNYCFPIIYTVKGLQKVCSQEEKVLLHQTLVEHRRLGYMLIRGLVEAFSLVDAGTLQRWEHMHPGIEGSKKLYATARTQIMNGHIDDAMNRVLCWYEEQIQHIMDEVNAHISVFSASKREIWQGAYDAWKANSLLTSSAVRKV